MGRHLPPTGLAACFVSGVALWFTRASLGVVPGPHGETRVAMFPSPAELVGLIVLSFVLLLLAMLGLRRVLGVSRSGSLDSDVLVEPLLPLFSLLWVAVPYLPWIPDRVPALRALAGPARFGLWAIVLGQIAWLSWDLVQRHRGRVSTATDPRRRIAGSWLVLVAGVAAYNIAAARLVAGPTYPGGDEPHYLVITQSLLRDGDLQIENNHQRRDYREYYRDRELRPDFIARAPDGTIYSIHPIGISLLVAPAFLAGGYRAATIFLSLLAAAAAALAWRWAARESGSAESATVGWLAVAGSASFTLHSFAVFPEMTAGAALLVAVARLPGANDSQGRLPIVHGLMAAALPWLGTKYAPLSAVLVLIGIARWRTARQAALLCAPYAISLAAWSAYFYSLWGSPLPTAPYGSAHQMDVRHVLIGLPALFFDQEYGLLPYAPALMLAFPGLWRMWKLGGLPRRQAIEITVLVASLLVTVSSYAMWWGGSSPPARQAVAGLLLLVLPIAWWDREAGASLLRRAAGRVLVLCGLTVTAILVGARDGLLAANRRDGGSQLLDWLGGSNDLVRLAPSYILDRASPTTLLIQSGIWTVVAVGTALILRRVWLQNGRGASVAGLQAVLVTGLAGAVLVPIAAGARLRPRTPPTAAAESPMLATFDARARPSAVLYSALRPVAPETVPPLFIFEGRPGFRRDPQPVRVLLNMRLALPAGEYEVVIEPADGARLHGDLALQVGRMGPPLPEWSLNGDPNQPWRRQFRLDVDSSFVGFRAPPELERSVRSVRVRPITIVNESDRIDRQLELPPVLAASQYKAVRTYFHGAEAYTEPAGFWVRGASELTVTLARTGDADGQGITLRIHTGARPNHVRFSTGVWKTQVALDAGQSATVTVPTLPYVTPTVLRIAPTGGFVPAETSGGDDRRLLGCWIEVL